MTVSPVGDSHSSTCHDVSWDGGEGIPERVKLTCKHIAGGRREAGTSPSDARRSAATICATCVEHPLPSSVRAASRASQLRQTIVRFAGGEPVVTKNDIRGKAVRNQKKKKKGGSRSHHHQWGCVDWRLRVGHRISQANIGGQVFG